MRDLKYTEILKANKLLQAEVADQKPYPVRVLSNITCNQLGATLGYHLLRQRVHAQISFGNYDNVVQESFQVSDYQLVIVHYELLNVIGKDDCYAEDLDDEKLEELVTGLEGELEIVLRNLAKVPCVIFDRFSAAAFPVSPLRRNPVKEVARRLNQFLEGNKGGNTYLVDIDSIFTKIGTESAFDMKLYNLSKTLYTIQYQKEYTYLISPILLKVTGHAKKAVIFDCDNTLWKGILGEDGFDGIDMSFHSKVGALYHQIQQMAVWLSKHGVLVGLCSKNNPEDVSEVLERHTDMVLRKDDIVVSEVNWNDKASNLKMIAEELNIGLDSILFVDDSSFEINLIREQLPQVLCMQVPTAIYDYPKLFADYINTYFFFSESKADLDKTRQYKQQAKRNQAKRQFTDLESYLVSLQMEVGLHVDSADEIERVAQLTQKTNQFNLCTNRYTETQIEDILHDKNRHFVTINVKDKFGDSGLTGVVIVTVRGTEGVIDDLLMSCRIMGRNIEYALMDHVIRFLRDRGCDTVSARYLPTAKNKPVATYYDSLGFRCLSENETGKAYGLTIADYIPKDLKYIKID